MGLIVALVFSIATAYSQSQPVMTSRQAASETTAHIVSISLDSSHGGMAKGERYVGRIHRSRTGFILDREAIDSARVSTLLDALRSRASHVPKAQIADLATYVIDHCSSALNYQFAAQMRDKAFGAAALSTCKAGANTFVSEYLSPSNRSFHTDDYPQEAIVVKFDDGHTISAISKSQNAFMLPWRVVDPSSQTLVYDTAIAKSILALFGNNDVNADRLRPTFLAAEYAETLRVEPPASMPTPAPVVRNEPLQNAMASANVFAKWSELNGSRIVGEIGSPRWGGITVAFDCPEPTDATSAANCLATPIERADKLAALPWVRAISLRPQLQVQIVGDDFASQDIGQLSELANSRADLAPLLPLARTSGIVFWIEPAKQGDVDGSSTWVLLPDKRLILVAYNPGPLMSAAGLDESRLGGTGWYRKVAALFSADGVLIGPIASLPARERVADVSSITIESRGNGSPTKTVLEASDFQANDHPLFAAALSRLLDAIYSASFSPLASTSSAESVTLLRECDRITSQQLGAYASSRQASALFEQRCRDANNLTSFLEDYNNSPDGVVLEDGFNGSTEVTITYASGAILKLTSDSHLAYMIPWSITSTGVPWTSYDPDIGVALASITKRSDPNLTRLDGSILPQQYGTDIRQKLYQYSGHPAELPPAAILAPVLRRYAVAQGYRLENLVYDQDANSVVGMLSSPGWNSSVWVQFRCPVNVTKRDIPATLAASIALGTRLARIAWIRRALARPELRVMAYPWRSLQDYQYADEDAVDDFDNWPNVVSGSPATDIRRMSRSPGVAWFVLEQPQSIDLSIVAGQFSSDWMLLSNGTAVLGSYTLGMPEYIGLDSGIPSFGEGIRRYAGALVSPTGSVEPHPTLPSTTRN
jgi:hypothetical protein